MGQSNYFTPCASILYKLKDVLTSIPKSDLLHVTMAVIHVAGQRFLAV